MKVIKAKQKPLITIVCCVHGDEKFGLKVFRYFEARQNQYPQIKLVIANEPAIKANKRYLETDLNRSFPGKAKGKKEERLAAQILKEIQESKYVLDIHTTWSDLKLVLIATKLNIGTKEIINRSSAKHIAHIKPPLSGHGLVDYVDAGVSLEFGREYAKTPAALKEVIKIIDGLIVGKAQKKQDRYLFTVTKTIPKTEKLPKNVANYRLIPRLKVYPILLFEKAYPNIHAMAATKREEVQI